MGGGGRSSRCLEAVDTGGDEETRSLDRGGGGKYEAARRLLAGSALLILSDSLKCDEDVDDDGCDVFESLAVLTNEFVTFLRS